MLFGKLGEKMDLYQIFTIILSLTVIMASMFRFMWSRIDKRFDVVFQELKDIKISIQDLNTRVSRLETQDEERFRNEIKLLVSERRKEV